MAPLRLKVTAGLTGLLAAALSMEALTRKDGPLGRLVCGLLVRILVLGLRAAAPTAVLLSLHNLGRLVQTPGVFSARRALWGAASAWSLAEAAFLLYILQYRRHLDAQTCRRWQAVTHHSTEEKRRASMERYLHALTQVCRADPAEDGKTPKNKKPTGGEGRESHRQKVQKTGLLGADRPPKPISRYSSANKMMSSSNLLKFSSGNLLGVSARGQASVEDFLKLWDGKDDVMDSDVERLKWAELASFFDGPGCGEADDILSWLGQKNVQEWVAHYWFRGSTPEELETSKPTEYQELKRLVSMVLESAGIPHLPEERNPNVRCVRLLTDPLPVLHRPLALYFGTSLLCPLLTLQVMPRLGFHRERIGGLCYWHRQPRADVRPQDDIAGPRQTPLVFVHGLGVGLAIYYVFVYNLSRHHSAHLYVPEFPFLAMAPWESVPSAREIVAQLQDMLAANGHTAAHFVGHSFGAVVIGWMMKMSPSSVVCATLMDPAHFLVIKAETLCKVLLGPPKSPFERFIRYFAFRELFTVNLLCRNFFWEQSIMWPEDLHVPVVIELAGDDHIVASRFVRRLLDFERVARKQRRKISRLQAPSRDGATVNLRAGMQQQALQRSQHTEPIDVQWCEGFFHGEILFHFQATKKLIGKMRQMVVEAHGEQPELTA